jgi:hypothetical protein
MMTDPTKEISRATILTCSWKVRNLLKLSNTFLPQEHAFTIEAKLSSCIMISAAP